MNNQKLVWKYEDYYNDNGEVVGVLVTYYNNGVYSTEVVEKKGIAQERELLKQMKENMPVIIDQMVAVNKTQPAEVVADEVVAVDGDQLVVEERVATTTDLKKHDFKKGIALGVASTLLVTMIGLKLFKDQNKAITPIVVTNGQKADENDNTNGVVNNDVQPNTPEAPVTPVVEETKELILDKELTAKDIEEAAPAIVQYLAKQGMQRTEQDVYSLLYLVNSENITQEEVQALVDKNLLDDTVVKIISDGLSIISDITSFNSHKIDELQAAGTTITMNELISIKPFSISNAVDTANIEYNEAKQVEIVNTKDQEVASQLVLDHMHWITGAEMADSKYNNEEGSLGAEFAIKQIVSTTILQATEEFVTGTFSESVQLEIDDSADFIAFVRDTCGLEFQSKTK